MNLRHNFKPVRNPKSIAGLAVFSLLASVLSFIGFTPVAAATNIDLIVHVPLAAHATNKVFVTPTGGTEVSAPYKYADDYGSFAIVTVPAAQPEMAISTDGLGDGGTFTRVGAEIWLDESSDGFKSRYIAQNCSLEIHYIAGSNSDATNADLDWSDDLGNSGTITNSTVSTNTATFTFAGNCNAKTLTVNANISGTEKTSFAINLKTTGEAWIKDSWPLARTTQEWADGFAVIHWYRSGGYSGYGLHTWEINGSGYSGAAVQWGSPMASTGTDEWGVYWRIPIFDASTTVPYIIHSGDSKDPSALDQMLDLAKTGGEVWLKSGSADTDGYAKYSVPVLSDVEADLGRQKAIWLTPGVIAWPYPITAETYDGHAVLHYSENANLVVDESGVSGEDDSVVLEYAAGLTSALRTQYPYLRDYVALKIPANEQANVSTWVRGQVAIETLNNDKTAPLRISGVQLGDVLDALYPDAKNITPGISWNGNTPTITVWAPTAKDVNLELFD
ncbi:MAG: hypothetical protein RLZZ330_626, partial [Actinomycetota bacterium]